MIQAGLWRRREEEDVMPLNVACPHCEEKFELLLGVVPGQGYPCPMCRRTFRVGAGSSLALSLRREQALAGIVFDANVLADDLVNDCNALLKLGIMLDKGALGAKAAGVAGGACAAFQGHWLLGAAVAVGGLLANVATDGWKKIKLGQVRQKWFERLTSMSESQLHELASSIQHRHPALAVHARGLLAISSGVGF
jgi:phage-related tail fiber protein